MTEFFHDIISIQRPGNPFCSNLENKTKPAAEIQALLNQVPWAPASETIARNLGKIYMGAIHVANGLYTDNYTDFGIENNGPYDVSKKFGPNHTLVIKEFFHLKPTEVWPKSGRMKAKEIKLYNVYENVGVQIEPVTAHYNYNGNPITGLRHWALTLDGKPVPESRFGQLQEELAQYSVNQWQGLKEMDFETLKQKTVELRCYLFKEACDALSMDWKPTHEMRSAVQGKPLATGLFKIPENKEDERKYWNQMLDPRVDFYP